MMTRIIAMRRKPFRNCQTSDEAEALQKLSDFFGIDFKDMAEAMILVRENNDKDDGRVWVNKYQLVE